MALQDRVQYETSERKNALEAYVYRMRDRLSGLLAPFSSEPTREGLMKRLDAMEVRAPRDFLFYFIFCPFTAARSLLLCPVGILCWRSKRGNC